MAWRPNIDDVSQPRPSKRLLRVAMGIHGYPLYIMRDKHGAYACVYKDKVIVAKKYVYGNTVSCHKLALQAAIRRGVCLAMYIGDARKTYYFNPITVLDKGLENVKGGALMTNFSILLGHNEDKIMKGCN